QELTQRAAIADDAFERLIADRFDDSADRYNISQGFWDPVKAAISGDPVYGGNVPYALEGISVRNVLSFYFHSKCSLRAPATSEWFESHNMRASWCAPAAVL
ncbi:MAG TPA: hypothetical protein VM600_04195, partial [Actinomycetota bacterium]|nr:hypothetical protein [Actinomycetota bacterium]